MHAFFFHKPNRSFESKLKQRAFHLIVIRDSTFIFFPSFTVCLWKKNEAEIPIKDSDAISRKEKEEMDDIYKLWTLTSVNHQLKLTKCRLRKPHNFKVAQRCELSKLQLALRCKWHARSFFYCRWNCPRLLNSWAFRGSRA